MRHLDNAIIELLNRTDVLERRVAALVCGGKKMGDDPDEREIEELAFLILKVISETEDQ